MDDALERILAEVGGPVMNAFLIAKERPPDRQETGEIIIMVDLSCMQIPDAYRN